MNHILTPYISNILTPNIFKQFPEVVSAVTLRKNCEGEFDMSFGTNKPKDIIKNNRKILSNLFGFDEKDLITQTQVHGDNCRIIDDILVLENDNLVQGSDAIICSLSKKLVCVSIADCIGLLLYDPKNRIIAGVHSGWRSSKLNITSKTILKMKEKFGTKPEELFAYISPSAGVCCYEVGLDFLENFDERYFVRTEKSQFKFDNKLVVKDQLMACGVGLERIEVDKSCTICNSNYHSFRRDKEKSGRAFAVIGLR